MLISRTHCVTRHRAIPSPKLAALMLLLLSAACGEIPTTPRAEVARAGRFASSSSGMPVHAIAPGLSGYAMDIAEDGSITGTIGSPERPFIWRDGVLTVLDLPPGAAYAQSYAINESGHLAVKGWFPGQPFSVARSYLWRPGLGYTDIGTLGHTSAQVSGMNNLDQLVGYSATTPGGSARPFIWSPGSTMQLLTPGAFGGAVDINDAGDVIFNTSGARLLRSDGSVVNLFGGSQALDINELGQSAGHGILSFSPVTLHAYTWDRDGVRTDLTPDLASGIASATAINDHGTIAGVIAGVATVWINGRPHTLAPLNGANGHPTAISNSGRVVGLAAGTPVYWDIVRTTDVVLSDLAALVEGLAAEGAISSGTTQALSRLLDQVMRSYEAGRASVPQLRAFLALVDAQERGGRLTSAQAAELRALAEEAIAMLQ